MKVLLLSVVCLPSLLLYAEMASSLALGTSIISSAIVIWYILKYSCVRIRSHLVGRYLMVAVLLSILLLTHLFAAGVFAAIDIGRAVCTLAVMILMMAAAGVVAYEVRTLSSRDLERTVFTVWLLLSVVGALGITQYGPTMGKYFKPVPPFTEPSIFALAYLPWTLAMVSSVSQRGRLLIISVTAALGLGLQNLTLLVGLLIVVFTCLRVCFLFLFILALAIGVFILDGEYYLSRLVFSEAEPNLSTLVYLQGWQMVLDAWQRTTGFGLGFQQLGISGESDVTASQMILAINGEHMNLLDGGFVAAKFLSELGGLGATVVIAYVIAAGRGLLLLRRSSLSPAIIRLPVAVRLQHSFLAAFLIDMFIRGTGYVTPSFFFLAVGLILAIDGRSSRAIQARVIPVALNHPRIS